MEINRNRKDGGKREEKTDGTDSCQGSKEARGEKKDRTHLNINSQRFENIHATDRSIKNLKCGADEARGKRTHCRKGITGDRNTRMGQGLFRSGWIDGPGMEKKISRRNSSAVIRSGEDGGRGGEEMETRSVLGGSGTTEDRTRIGHGEDTTRVGG